jgi:hypothetical protein
MRDGDLAPSINPAAEDEVDEMIRMGWGSTRREMIPADWRTRKGPWNRLPLEAKKRISEQTKGVGTRRARNTTPQATK